MIAEVPSARKRLRTESGGSRSPIVVWRVPSVWVDFEGPSKTMSLGGCVSEGGRRGSCSSSERERSACALIRRAAL